MKKTKKKKTSKAKLAKGLKSFLVKNGINKKWLNDHLIIG
jgi:hypothetical protein